MPQERSTVPTAVAVFPTDIAIRPFASQAGHIVRWSELDRGGHFAALEAPDLLTADIREFFRTLSREAGGPGGRWSSLRKELRSRHPAGHREAGQHLADLRGDPPQG
jgi:hypothetical protein